MGEDGAGGVEEAEDVCVEAVVGFFWAGGRDFCRQRSVFCVCFCVRAQGIGGFFPHFVPCLLDRPFENVSRGVDEDVEAAACAGV